MGISSCFAYLQNNFNIYLRQRQYRNGKSAVGFSVIAPKGFLSAASIYLTFVGRFDNMINDDFRCVRSKATEWRSLALLWGDRSRHTQTRAHGALKATKKRLDFSSRFGRGDAMRKERSDGIAIVGSPFWGDRSRHTQPRAALAR